ncbi:MAG: lipid-A-disaccharide synthase [Epsilonproteobacteria bacterium]|nr:lipid-A-disaccharide synthase [Campylobacterota bacterium]
MNLLVSALEPSANLHLEPILNKLETFTLSGIFDQKFGTPLYQSSEFSVMGFLDILPKIFKAKEAIAEMVFLAKEVDTILLIDSPAFNLPLAKAIKKRYPEKKIVYYILPKVWAWKKGRVKQVEAYCDVLASIFPFEEQFYNKSIYIGNPLLDEIIAFKDPQKTYHQIAFLPGSRKSEIKKLMPIFKETAQQIESKKVLVIPKFLQGEDLTKIYGDIDDFDISYDMQSTLTQSDFAFICSGTATLEATIIGTPFVLAYKAKKLDYFIASRLVKLSHVGLANIIMDFAGKQSVHQELLQEDVTVKNLLNAYETFDTEKFYKKAKDVKNILQHGAVDHIIPRLI